MALRSVLIILAEILITKVISSYMQPYSSIPYAIRDPRAPIPYQDYQSLYAHYASQIFKPTYQRPPAASTQQPRPVEYRQQNYPNSAKISPPAVQHVKFQPPNCPAQTAVAANRSPSCQKTAEVVPPVIPSQTPVEYRMLPYQKTAQYTTPAVQTIEYRSSYPELVDFVAPPLQRMEIPSTYQNAAEILLPIDQSVKQVQPPIYQKIPELTPIIQNPLEYYQPAYQKIANFVAKNPLETQQTKCCKTDLSPTFTSSEIPLLTSSALESLQSSTLCKSDFLTPKSNSDTLDSNVLNNLAIALQLLIVNNIINHPRSESISSMSNLPDSLQELVYSKDLPVSNSFGVQPPCEMHNAKFLGSSNFAGDGLMSKGMLGLGSLGAGLPLPRPGFNLMSPYDAIAATPSSLSPFSDSPSLFALKNNFQSPYAAIIAADNNNDLFSMSDLF